MSGYDDNRFRPPAPVAVVTLRHPEHDQSITDVSMLIDSGADATLLPASAIASLGIVGTGEKYQLVAFDGSMSESEAVRVDLILLKKKFRGRYLLIDLAIEGRRVRALG